MIHMPSAKLGTGKPKTYPAMRKRAESPKKKRESIRTFGAEAKKGERLLFKLGEHAQLKRNKGNGRRKGPGNRGNG